ncbi:MAG: homogentisate 1,2-dioxygenase [Chlamydiales bacterium]|jgi:homogentisate 1,2-dioxygenase
MHRYHTLGKIPPKRHTILQKPDGGIYYEELKGNKGFSGPSSLLYHIHRPTQIKSTKLLSTTTLEKDPDPSVRMRHLRSAQIKTGGSPTMDRTPVMFNNDVTLSMAYPDKEDDFYFRNSQADEVIYVSHGSGVLETAYGETPYKDGDYIVIPRGILHRYRLGKEKNCFFIIEGVGEIKTPPHYRNEYGQLVERSPYSERDFKTPGRLTTIDKKEDTPIRIKHRDSITEVILNHHPFDVVGWDGYYYPYTFSIHDFEPIVGRIHEPPPVHLTFQGHNFVICSFCPRPYDFDKNAIPAPYHHANVMSDEVIYYAKENFMSRKGVEYGSITLHPDGLTHGPHPGKTEESIGKKYTDELAVMVDTFYPLHVTKNGLKIEDPDYTTSWLE